MVALKLISLLALVASVVASTSTSAPCPMAAKVAAAKKETKHATGSRMMVKKQHHHHHHHHKSSHKHKSSGGSKSTKPKKVTTPKKKTSPKKTSSKPKTHKTDSTPSSGGSGATNGLDLHNSFRAKYGAKALVWDADIAAGAQAYSETCANGHSGVNGLGENLSWGTKDINSGIQLWLNEAKSYDYSKPGFSMTTGHFTQVVWKATTKVGCGFSKCGGQYGTMVTCRYSPPGNYVNAGEFQKNVGRPK